MWGLLGNIDEAMAISNVHNVKLQFCNQQTFYDGNKNFTCLLCPIIFDNFQRGCMFGISL